MPNFNSILPVNEEAVERTIEELGSDIFNFDDLEKVTIDAMKCDAAVLPHLALDLDVSIVGLEIDEARVYLSNAREIKRLTGSVWAVNSAASSVFGKNIKVKPWNEIQTVPGTYKIEVDVTPSKSVNDENLNKVIKLIDEAKPESRHLAGITINMKSSGLFNHTLVSLSSENILVGPKIIEDINSSINYKVVATCMMIETATLKPKEA